MRFGVPFILSYFNNWLPAAPYLGILRTNGLVAHRDRVEHRALGNVRVVRNSNKVSTCCLACFL